MADVNQKAFDNQRKTLHARLANALTAMDKLSGYGVYDDSDEENIKDTAAESFVVDGLSKVYKIKNICSVDKMLKCGVSETYTTVNGESATMATSLRKMYNPSVRAKFGTAPVAIETNNGESVVVYYNPNCGNKIIPGSAEVNFIPDKMCVNFIYDLNGPKAPNMMGKDMGIITAFYKEEPIVVAPVADDKSMLEDSHSSLEAADACDAIGSDYRLPTTEELVSLAINMHTYLSIKYLAGEYFQTSDVLKAGGADGGMAAAVHIPGAGGAMVKATNRNGQSRVLCVKR